MARKSRKHPANESTIQLIKHSSSILEETIPTAAYGRLSYENAGKEDDESLKNQMSILHKYIEEHPDLRHAGDYMDDGYTGTNYDRPGFQRLLQDIDKGKVNCIIVKDLSRLGRNYIETGRYLEMIFPMMGVRFIAITDNYDSNNENADAEQIIVPFKNLINDAYCRDISIKIRSQFDIKRKKGEFIGSYACYGYRKDPENKNHLIIDPEAAEVVRMIFDMFLDGYLANKISEKLNEMKIPTPCEYKIRSGLHYNTGFKGESEGKWYAIQVLRILKNETYIGTVVQGKKQKINYKVKGYNFIDKSDWIRVPDMHEPIISKDIFALVQELLGRDHRTSPGMEKVNDLSGFVRCPECGQIMIIRHAGSHGRKYRYYSCEDHLKHKDLQCHRINEKKLKKVVLAAIQEQAALMDEASALLREQGDEDVFIPGLRPVINQIQFLEKEASKYQGLIARLYQDLYEGIVDKKEYLEMNARFTKKLKEAKDALEVTKEKKASLISSKTRRSEHIELFRKYKGITQIERRIVVFLIDHIAVYDKNHIEIHFRYEDELMDILQWLRETDKDNGRKEVAL